MNEAIDTGFKDKSGRTIYVGDILQHRLGKFGKSGGTKNYKVILFGKKYQVVDESREDYKFGGLTLSLQFCENAVVIQSSQIRS